MKHNNPSWRETAISLLWEATNACLASIIYFVDTHWQGFTDDEDNITAFSDWQSGYNNAFTN